jgi:hypothetical protein
MADFKLQFANLKEMEVFERTDRAQALWGQPELPEVVVRPAPVEYTYPDLEERRTARAQMTWSRRAIRFIVPAIDVSGCAKSIRKRSRRRWRSKPEAASASSPRARRETWPWCGSWAQATRCVRTWLLSRYDDASSTASK